MGLYGGCIVITGETMTIEQIEARIAYLDKEIAEYPYWGAALSAMDEERQGLLRRLADLRAREAQL